MIGCDGIRDRRGLRTMILICLYWDIREICDPLLLCGLLLGAALVIYDVWFRLPERVRGIHRNTEEHVQQVKLVPTFSSSAAAAADYLATIFLDDFPFPRAAPDSLVRRLDGPFGQETLTEAVRGGQYVQRGTEPADLLRAGRGREQERGRVCRVCRRWGADRAE